MDDISELFLDLKECGLGAMTPNEAQHFEVAADDFVKKYGRHPELLKCDVPEQGHGRPTDEAYWAKYLKMRTALPKGSMGTTISVGVNLQQLDYGIYEEGARQSEVAATFLLSMTNLIRLAGKVAMRSRQAGNNADVLRLAATTRLPGEECDSISFCDGADHWCILSKGTIYVLEVPRVADVEAYAGIVAAFEAIIHAQQESVPNLLPAITAVDRGRAARLREALLDIDETAEPIQRIESALGVVVLDHRPAETSGAEFQYKMMIGNGFDRWFGKTTFVFGTGRWAGIQLDHGVFNGERGQKLVALLLMRSKQLHCDLNGRQEVHAEPQIEMQRLVPPTTQSAMDLLLPAYRSSGQIETAFTTAGRTLEYPDVKRTELAEILAVAAQLVAARRRGMVQEILVPVKQVGSSSESADYIHAAFESALILFEDAKTDVLPDPVLVRNAMQDWRRWFRRGLLGSGIESRLKAVLAKAQAAGMHHRLFDHKLISARRSIPTVMLTIMSAPEAVGARIYVCPPMVRNGWMVCAYVGKNQVRIDMSSDLESAEDVMNDIAEMMERLVTCIRS